MESAQCSEEPVDIFEHSATSERLACSVGGESHRGKSRNPVAWVAFVEEMKRMKPTDKAILGMAASHRAVTKVNAEVASKVSSPRGRTPNCRVKAAWIVAGWLKRRDA